MMLQLMTSKPKPFLLFCLWFELTLLTFLLKNIVSVISAFKEKTFSTTECTGKRQVVRQLNCVIKKKKKSKNKPTNGNS